MSGLITLRPADVDFGGFTLDSFFSVSGNVTLDNLLIS